MRNRAARLARRHDQHPLDRVAQLAHVAGPVGGLQHRHGIVADRRAAASRNDARRASMKCRASSGMSIRRSASGGIAKRHDVQAVKQVLAEPAGWRSRP